MPIPRLSEPCRPHCKQLLFRAPGSDVEANLLTRFKVNVSEPSASVQLSQLLQEGQHNIARRGFESDSDSAVPAHSAQRRYAAVATE